MGLENYKNSGEFPPANDDDEGLSSTEELSSELKPPGGLELETPLEPLEVEEQEVADDPIRLYLHEIG